MKLRKIFVLGAVIFIFTFVSVASARGGGGGSGGGGGGGGGFSGGSGSGGRSAGIIDYIVTIIIVLISAYAVYKRKKKIANAKKLVAAAEIKDTVWDDEALLARVRQVFFGFQAGWSKFDDKAIKPFLTEEYYKRIVLELNVLVREKRQNLVNFPQIQSVNLFGAHDDEVNSKDAFTVEIVANADDSLIESDTRKELYRDTSTFTEYWNFVRVNNEWCLNSIDQATKDQNKVSPAIMKFAEANKFYYDADFGWLMMPNKGVLFKKSNFKTSDINNHVIGYYRKTIVEFYTFIPTANNNYSKNYFVGQAILPISYKNILIKKKKWFNADPAGLRRIELESADFNKKFCLWADPQDQVSSLELLTPDFMEKIYELPFDLNIEIVGSFLYFYCDKMPDDGYNKMLEILTWAFDQMRM